MSDFPMSVIQADSLNSKIFLKHRYTTRRTSYHFQLEVIMVLEQSQKRGMTIECNEQQSREWDNRKGPEDLGVNFIYIN